MFPVVINLILVVFAAGVNAWASRRGDMRMRPLWAATSIVCLVYVVAYLWLLFTDVDRARWSQQVVGVGIPAWVIGWMAPAWMSVHLFNRDRHRLDEKASP